jgi:hypothetical protein
MVLPQISTSFARMEKGFPEVTAEMIAARAASREVSFGRVSSDKPAAPPAQQPPTSAPPAVDIVARSSRRRAFVPAVLALGTCGVVVLALITFTGQPMRHHAVAPSKVEIAQAVVSALPPAPLVFRPRAPRPAPEPDKPFTYEDVPTVPEAYSGDPAGQALWEKTVDDDQQTLQPEDLEEGPPRQLPDLRQTPEYRAQNIDADGNVN